MPLETHVKKRHVYKDILTPIIREELAENLVDMYAVCNFLLLARQGFGLVDREVFIRSHMLLRYAERLNVNCIV